MSRCPCSPQAGGPLMARHDSTWPCGAGLRPKGDSMPRPRRLHSWLASLVGLGWLLGLALPGAHAGAFRVAETYPRDPRAAALWQHPQVTQAIRVWAAVATELFRLPTDVTVTPAPCGRMDGFYDPVQQQLRLCEELLIYYAGVLTPPGGDPGSPEDERTVLAGSAALVQRSRTPEPPHLVPWWAHHPWTDVRAAHLQCLLAGSHPP